ncbi:uncharacterized protein LOC120840202 [Ixodes scapularis]|uniref:uncharacterized protein LOC120840202 n=1 Tax=Ixodes scapularis TaxID=6945 RepID=UPI001A9DCD86|nr:uncharacterized protein LOC120840202 [Ixodes scapularis]
MEAAQAGVPDAANTALSITPEQHQRNEARVTSQPDDGHSICSDGSVASSTTDINCMEQDDDTGGPYQEVRSRKRTRRNNSNSSSETIIQSKAIEEGLTVVFAPADTETLITSLSSVKLSRALENSCPEGIHEVRFNSRLNVIAVDTRNGEATRTLLNLKALCGIPVMSYSPLAGATVNGMIQDVDKELSNEEITSHLRSNINVGAVRRLGKSSTVKVTFRGKILPTHVLLGHVRHPVHPFQERPIQCLNCFGFGHKRVTCKRPKKCEHCGKPHESTDITCQSMPAKCVNCGQEHEATARFCSKRKKLGEIQAYSKSNLVGFHVAKSALEYDELFPEMESTQAGSNATKEPTVTELKNSGERDMEETLKDVTTSSLFTTVVKQTKPKSQATKKDCQGSSPHEKQKINMPAASTPQESQTFSAPTTQPQPCHSKDTNAQPKTSFGDSSPEWMSFVKAAVKIALSVLKSIESTWAKTLTTIIQAVLPLLEGC